MKKSLKKLAEFLTETKELYPDDPSPPEEFFGCDAVGINAKQIKCSLWGKPEAITFSISKNDVWDRRLIAEPPLKAKELYARVYENGDPGEDLYYASYGAYDFPCPKPVGQLIVTAKELAGAESPKAVRHYSNGVVGVSAKKDTHELAFQVANMMARNVLTYEFSTAGLGQLGIRLYRHLDSYREYDKYYFCGDGKAPASRKGFDYEKDRPFNDPMEPPENGSYEDMAYIRQKFPAERTFPDGFEYVFAARVVGIKAEISFKEGYRLGTPAHITKRRYDNADKSSVGGFMRSGCAPQYERINEMFGVAADFEITPPAGSARFALFATVVTSAETKNDPVKTAYERLAISDAASCFDENRHYYDTLYDAREKGRIFFFDEDGRQNEKNENVVKKAFKSWTFDHSGGTASDPYAYQSDNTYAYMNSDYSPWHGDVHFNEVAPTEYCVLGQFDRLAIWEKLLTMLLPAAKTNAQKVYGMDGAFYGLSHVPCDMDIIYHSHEVWENSMELSAQNILAVWRCYEYSGDIGYVRRIYEVLYESALFYSQYVTLGDDGKYHVIPTVSAEHHGFTKKFELNKDSTSALCLIAWNLEACVEATELLGLEMSGQIRRFGHIAANMADYPTHIVDGKEIYADIQNSTLLEFNLTAPLYPVFLSDHINLDSGKREIETAIRTAEAIDGWSVGYAKILLGITKGTSAENLINSRSGDIHLFPCVEEGANVGFMDMRAKKGFLVSANYINKTVCDLMVTSNAGAVCRIAFPAMPEKITVVDTATGDTIAHKKITGAGVKDRIEFNTNKGYAYRIEMA
ncbi:MAG: hypothetical protein FWG34_13770 [Oscillospiraceae bacterium]|nr:hypothetical protein [Oscillospiraceae bacterium]